MFTFSIRRRDLAWGVALIVLLTTIWIARSDLADAGVDPPGEGIAVVYVTSGLGFPDALGVGPGAALGGAPIILVPPTGALDPDTTAELERLDPRTVIIVGGTSSVSAATMIDIQNMLPNADVTRISGTNRYKTNAAFSAATYPIEGWASVNAVGFTALNPDVDDLTHTGAGVYNVTSGEVFAAIQLPHGAEILEFELNTSDGDGAINIQCSLYRADAVGTLTVIASVATTSNTGNQTKNDLTMTAGTEIVDNDLYSYYIYAAGLSNALLIIRSAEVRYRLGVSTGS